MRWNLASQLDNRVQERFNSEKGVQVSSEQLEYTDASYVQPLKRVGHILMSYMKVRKKENKKRKSFKKIQDKSTNMLQGFDRQNYEVQILWNYEIYKFFFFFWKKVRFNILASIEFNFSSILAIIKAGRWPEDNEPRHIYWLVCWIMETGFYLGAKRKWELWGEETDATLPEIDSRSTISLASSRRCLITLIEL